jgi:sucrose-phosphate synthase
LYPSAHVRGLNIQLISMHGLLRSQNIELGRDADTGGQILYVVELAKALAMRHDVNSVELVTRQFAGPDIDPEYSQPIEFISEKARIIRIPCGPVDYLRKEDLWPHLEEFIRNIHHHNRKSAVKPDVVHGHYADAGHVGARLAADMDIPFVFTGHSLGRVKQERLMADGATAADLEPTFHFQRRFQAEEKAIAEAAFVVTSTTQEIQDQYKVYHNYCPDRMQVIAPGVDLSRFNPTQSETETPAIKASLDRFLRDPEKPMILAVARPDVRKNFTTLLHAYGRDAKLREKANLVLIAGNRDGVAGLKAPERKVINEILELIDEYDLYGQVAYPKHHTPEDVPDIYRLAAAGRGVFVNPALTEPFGLTLIEAAACGLPIVATEDGGPVDIIKQCCNGLLIDPLDASDIASALHSVLDNEKAWNLRSENGISRTREHYSWPVHVDTYIENIRRAMDEHLVERRLGYPTPYGHVFMGQGASTRVQPGVLTG